MIRLLSVRDPILPQAQNHANIQLQSPVQCKSSTNRILLISYFLYSVLEALAYVTIILSFLILLLLLLINNALATVPSRRYRSLPAAVPSRLDGTVAGEATVPSTQSRSRYR